VFQLLSQVDRQDVVNLAKEHLKDCQLPGCEHASLGFSCTDCGRFVCHSHTYWSLPAPGQGSMKPLPRCPLCVVDSHPELFEVDDE
jgi:hypothetical protein